MEPAARGTAYAHPILCNLPSSGGEFPGRNVQAPSSGSDTFSAQLTSPQHSLCSPTLEPGHVFMQPHIGGIGPSHLPNMYWACVRRDLCDDDGQQHYAVARRVSTQSDCERFDTEVFLAAAASRCQTGANLTTTLPLVAPTLPIPRKFESSSQTPGAEGVVHSGDSDGDHYCCETDPCADDGASGLFDNGVYSLLQLDSSSVLSPWIDEVMSSPHCAVDPVAPAPDCAACEPVSRPVPACEQIQAPKGSHAYKPLSTPEDEPHKPAAAGTEAAADQEHAATGTAAYRAAALARYRNKRQRRKFGRGARYGLRKANADSRPRIGGRFVGRAQAAAIRASEAAAAAASTTSSPQQ
mmetsp:Transcript_2813/g.7041  ORF Transcript_2813/g.7041 Transcript_2813/m.7041 type:complete len:353 (-) Transcript_2813:351-1409(-)